MPTISAPAPSGTTIPAFSRKGAPWRTRIRPVLLVGGVLSPLLYLASDVVASVRFAGYSSVDQTISELNAIGAPTRALTIAFGLVVYVLLIAFGIGIWHSATGNRRLRAVGGVLVGLGVLSLWAVPFASMQVRGAAQGPAHVVEGMVAVLLLITAMGFAATTMGRRFRLYTIGTIAVMLAFGALTGMDGPRIAEGLSTPWVGVKERISVYSYQLWLVVLALTLLRQRFAPGADGATPGPGRAPPPRERVTRVPGWRPPARIVAS